MRTGTLDIAECFMYLYRIRTVPTKIILFTNELHFPLAAYIQNDRENKLMTVVVLFYIIILAICELSGEKLLYHVKQI